MRKQASILAVVLIAASLCAGQTQGPDAKSQVDAAPEQTAATQATTPPPEIPKFFANSRQVIVEAEVWSRVDKNDVGDASLVPPISVSGYPDYGASGLKTLEGLHLPPPARGLIAKEFQVFDNGVERRINYFKEADFPAVWGLTTQWTLYPTTRGTWGFPILPLFGGAYAHSATYLIGYVPPTLQPGECRTIQIVVPNHYVQANRKQYCALKDSEAARTAEETELDARMLRFASTTALGKIHVSVGAFAFWSSSVLTLARQTPSTGPAPALPATDFTFVVEVHDSKAPASVQIATQFLLPDQMWNAPCPKNAAIHILGTVYKTNGELAGQFGDTFRCDMWHNPISERIDKVPGSKYQIPTVFNTEIELRSGQYKVRVLVTDGKNFGRGYAALRVEPLNAAGLAVSDVALDSIRRDASLIVRDAAKITPDPLVPAPLVSKIATPGPVPEAPPLVQDVQFLPFPYAQLGKGSPLSVYFEIYRPVPDAADTAIYYRMRITDVKTGATVTNTEPISAADFAVPGNSVVPIGLRLGTNELGPGSYRLEVQASDSAGRESEWRQAKFNIE